MPRIRMSVLLAAMVLLSGCTSFGRGVAEAVLDPRIETDTRACHVEGPASYGLETLLREQEEQRKKGAAGRQMKVLMVHGIGKHLPGYSGRFTEHLMRAFGLGVREQGFKEIVLRDPRVSDNSLGELRISRYTNKERSRELLFYELTWSTITDGEKAIIEFDDSTEYAFRRASLNARLKRFFNSHVPDSLVFLGEPHQPILASVRQSLCWMTRGDWNDYPAAADNPCNPLEDGRARYIQEDDFVLVTHSLGSRIVLDSLQYFGNATAARQEPQVAATRKVLVDKEIRLYMLANQLPLLEMGQRRAEVRGQTENYCRPAGPHFDQRILRRLSIYAFSDPNDILSYPIPPRFAEQYIDSRLCPSPTNITINVAKPISVLGLGEFADPGAAHAGYDADKRVIALVAHGIGHGGTAKIVTERCSWLETTETGF